MFSYIPTDEDWLGCRDQHTGPTHGGEVQRSVESHSKGLTLVAGYIKCNLWAASLASSESCCVETWVYTASSEGWVVKVLGHIVMEQKLNGGRTANI